jgi:hypothetical protein
MDEIKLRLGYRFVLRQMDISQEVKPGGILHMILNIDNVGFGALFNPRDLELVLQNGSQTYVCAINRDPRRWEPGSPIVLDKYFRIPANIPEGYYAVKLNLPDPKTSLHNNPLYSIRLANISVWESSTGYNILQTGLHIYQGAPGSSTEDTTFQEIENPFTVSGQVTGDVIANVTINLYQLLCGGLNLITSTTTNPQGYYSFAGLSEGLYRATPEHAGCSFSPAASAVMIPRTEYNPRNFTSTCPGG